MEPSTRASRETLDESIECSTPSVPEDIPVIEQVETPPPVGTSKPDQSNIKMKLSAFASPFKSKSFHLGSVKRSKLSDSKDDSDKEVKETKRWKKKKKKSEEITTDEEQGAEAETEGVSGEEEMLKGKRKKKSGARSKAGAFVRKLGSLGGRRGARESPEPGGGGDKHSSGSSSLTPASVKRRTPDGQDGPSSDPSINDDGSRYGSVENLAATRADMFTPVDRSEIEPKETTDNNRTESLVEENNFPETIKEEVTSESVDRDVSDADRLSLTDPLGSVHVSAIATTHPVSTLPFAKSTWKRNKAKSVQVIPRPIESPSPEDALRRRISFVAQASVCLSEDKEDWDPAAVEYSSPRLSRMVQLAQQRRRSSAQSADRSPELSEAATPDPEASQDAERTDDEEFQDTEETRLLPERGMPPFGDFIDGSEAKRDMGSGTSSHPAQVGMERREHLYKILVIGELGTGKTSIIKRYVHQFYSQHYRATIGVDFALKVLNWDSNTTIRLQLWDIAGQERFGNMTRVYYKEAVGAFVVFDVTRVATFEAVLKWKQDLDSKVQLPDGSPIPCVLLANKCDQQKEGIANTPIKMDEYCKEKGFAGWFETSAKENINIEEAARSLVNKILLNDKLLQSSEIRDGEKFALEGQDGGAEEPVKRKACGC